MNESCPYVCPFITTQMSRETTSQLHLYILCDFGPLNILTETYRASLLFLLALTRSSESR